MTAGETALHLANHPFFLKASRAENFMATEWDVEELVRKYEAGATLDDLAFELRSNNVKIRRILVEAGVTIRKRGTVKGAPRRSYLDIRRK